MTGIEFVLGSLFTFRAAWLLANDTITEPLREWLDDRSTTAALDLDSESVPSRTSSWVRWHLSTVVECPWCNSVWIGYGTALFVGGPWRIVVLAGLGFSAIAGLGANLGEFLAAGSDNEVVDRTGRTSSTG